VSFKNFLVLMLLYELIIVSLGFINELISFIFVIGVNHCQIVAKEN